PGKVPTTDKSIAPGAPFVTVTVPGRPVLTPTSRLSAFTHCMAKSTVFGIAAGRFPGSPFPGVPLPKGVFRNCSWSTYQYHLPFITFQVLPNGTFKGLSVNPGIITNCEHTSTAFAFLKFSE